METNILLLCLDLPAETVTIEEEKLNANNMDATSPLSSNSSQFQPFTLNTRDNHDDDHTSFVTKMERQGIFNILNRLPSSLTKQEVDYFSLSDYRQYFHILKPNWTNHETLIARRQRNRIKGRQSYHKHKQQQQEKKEVEEKRVDLEIMPLSLPANHSSNNIIGTSLQKNLSPFEIHMAEKGIINVLQRSPPSLNVQELLSFSSQDYNQYINTVRKNLTMEQMELSKKQLRKIRNRESAATTRLNRCRTFTQLNEEITSLKAEIKRLETLLHAEQQR